VLKKTTVSENNLANLLNKKLITQLLLTKTTTFYPLIQ